MNQLSHISFIIARHREPYFQACTASLERLGVQDVVGVSNAPSIFAAYDEGLKFAKHETVCFLHEDVVVNGLEERFLDALLAAPDTGLLGIAGTRVLNRHAIWWQGEHDTEIQGTPGALSGLVRHAHPDDSRTLNYYGAFGQVVALDGVCLLARKETILRLGGFADAGLTGFDFYDISISIRAHLAGLRNYTMPIDLTHWGVGNIRPSWEQNRQAFLAKYAHNLPLSL